MCGIAGISLFPNQQLSPGILARLLQSMVHRGPDGSGEEIRNGVALVHTRLAIVDLENGSQPLSDGKAISLVANGEIYNDLELRKSFSGVFKTQSDCESPLILYKELGVDFIKHLRGMWGIAIHDSDGKILILSRDPFGIKPLYYAETSIGVIFASEIRAIANTELLSVDINNHIRDELLSLQFTTGAETIYRGINRILPGESLLIKEGRIIKKEICSVLPKKPPEIIDERSAIDKLDRILLNSVELHQRSDVPYGMFLSGGIDSSALLIAMSRLSDKPVSAYTLGFDTSSVPDEREQAAKVANYVGAEHHTVLMDGEDFWSMLPKVVAALDDPVIDYATLPTYKLAELASENLKVVLCGEGGDELFGGYGRYRKVMRTWWQGGSQSMRRHSVLLRANVLRTNPYGWRDGIKKTEEKFANRGLTSLQIAQSIDCNDWLPNDLLLKLDRCLMAHGVEGRTPFLDPEVASLAFCLPDRFKVRGRLGKWILRKWLQEQMPESNAFHRKRGFTVPIGEWINNRSNVISQLVARQPGIKEICEPEKVIKLFEQSTPLARNASWVLLFYSLWHNYHILGRPVGNNIGDALALN